MLREEIVINEIQHDLNRLGIAKNAGEEKMRARDAKLREQQENERMMKLYREHVLQEKTDPSLVQIGSILPASAPTPAAKVEEREEVGSFGD